MRKTNSGNIKFLIFIALISLVQTGCLSTQGTLNLNGKILEENTNAGIPWKNIIVQGIDYSDGKAKAIEVGQFSTDSSGNFSFALRKIKGVYNYNFCFLGKSEYPVTVLSQTLFELKTNSNYLTFQMSKLADLSIKLNRKSKIPTCDTLRLCWESNGVFGASLYPYTIYNYGKPKNTVGLTSTKDLFWIGGIVNSTINTRVYADKRTIITWELYRNGKRTEFNDTITCKKDITNIVYFSY